MLLGEPGIPLGASQAVESPALLAARPDRRPLPGGQAFALHLTDSLLSAVSDVALTVSPPAFPAGEVVDRLG